MVLAFDAARIRGEAEAGKAKSLGHYLDELLPDEVIAARIEQRFFETLDRQIAAGEASMQ